MNEQGAQSAPAQGIDSRFTDWDGLKRGDMMANETPPTRNGSPPSTVQGPEHGCAAPRPSKGGQACAARPPPGRMPHPPRAMTCPRTQVHAPEHGCDSPRLTRDGVQDGSTATAAKARFSLAKMRPPCAVYVASELIQCILCKVDVGRQQRISERWERLNQRKKKSDLTK